MASHLLKTAMWCAGSYSHVTIHEVVCRVPGYDVTHRGQQILESERGSVAGSPRHVITWIIWSVWNQWRDIPSCLCFRSSPDSTSTLKSAEHPIRRVDSLRCQSTRCFRRRVYIYIYIYIYVCVCVYIYIHVGSSSLDSYPIVLNNWLGSNVLVLFIFTGLSVYLDLDLQHVVTAMYVTWQYES